ncbi:MAG: hypothetical protein FWD26_00915 [Treponema sp.]|nr:hypothetical protein [Treponema sp.]
MKSKIILLISAFTAILVISCSSVEPAPEDTFVEINQQSNTFDPARVSQMHYASTREEVQQFINNLNQIIRNRNFNAWRDVLSQEYIDTYSSAENLHRISEQPLMKRTNTVLRNLNDYFTHVFVPSRNPDRIQINNIDIEFIRENRVRAFAIRVNNAGEEHREILYDLEKINNSWKIIN